MKKSKLKYEFITIIWIFLITSFLGFIWETLLYFFKYQIWIRKNGLLFLPLSQVYGIGGIIFYLVLIKFYKKKNKTFVISTVLGGIVEFFLSYFQELIFGTISWNYSKYFLNIQGRTSLFHALCWGFVGMIFVKNIYPLCKKIINYLYNANKIYISYILLFFLIFDILISSFVCIRYKKRNQKINPSNKIEIIIDKYFPDQFMHKAYPHFQIKK